MATCGNQSPEQEKDVKDTFYDIDACSTTPLSILLKINQPSTAQTPKRPLIVGVMIDRIGCIIATKKQLVKTTMDIEEQRRATREFEQKKQEFEEEQQASRIQIKDLLDKFEEQVKRIEMVHSRSTVGPIPIDVVTPQVSDAGLVSPVLQHASY